LSGESHPKYNLHPKMEVQCVENCTIAVDFASRVTEGKIGISGEEINKKNQKMVLGLVWRLILHFQVFANQDLEESSAAKRIREAKTKLLEWCKDQTKGYNNINIEDFTDSWYDVLAFCALVNSFDSSLLDYDACLSGADKKANLHRAFKIAEEKMGIPALMEAEDIVQEDPNLIPNEQCFITYISQFPVAFLDKVAKDKDAEADKKVKEAERKLREEEEARRRLEEERRREEEERKRVEEEKKRLEHDAKRKEEEDRKREEEERKRNEEKRRKKELKKEKERKKKELMDEEERKKVEDEKRKRDQAKHDFEAERKKLEEENARLREKYNQTKAKLIGKLKCTVVAARGLKKGHKTGKYDPYCMLFCERQKEKTRTVKRTMTPKWNAAFEFYVSEHGASLEVTVYDWNRILADDFIGRVAIPIADLTAGKEVDEWFPLQGKKNEKIAGEIHLIISYST